MVDYFGVGCACGFDFAVASFWVCVVGQRLAVLGLGVCLVIDVEGGGDFVSFGVCGGDFGLVAEGFVADVGVGEAVGFVVGVGFGRAACGCAFAFGFGFACCEARAIGVFVVGVEPGLAAFACGCFLNLGEASTAVVGVCLFGECACT